MPELVYDVKFRIDPASAQRVAGAASGVGGGQGAEQASQEVKELEVSLDRAAEAAQDLGVKSQRGFNKTKKGARDAGNAVDRTADGMNRFTDRTNKLGTAAARTSKNFSSANQVLFSFSDGINDAAQFSQGFGVGMRAVGNNIGFTIELFASLNNRVREYNAAVAAFNKANVAQIAAGEVAARRAMTTFGALRAAFAGPGGLLLAVNLVITAMTVLGTRTKKTEAEVKGLSEITKELQSVIGFDDSGIPDPFGLRALSFHIGMMEAQLSRFNTTTEQIAKTSAETALSIGAMAGGAGLTAGSIAWLTSRFERTQDISMSLSKIMGGVTDEFNGTYEAIKELTTEIEKQQITQQAYINFLNQDGNETLRAYVDLTKELSFEMTRVQINALNSVDSQVMLTNAYKSDIELRQELSGLIDEQTIKVNTLIASNAFLNDEILEQISLLGKLSSLYESLQDPIDSARDRIDSIVDASTPFGNAFEKISNKTAQTIESLTEIRGQFPELSAEVYKAIDVVERYDNVQKIALGAKSIQGLSKAAGQFGEIFDASKEFRIAMATIDALAAIVNTFATVPFPANIAAAAGIAASLAAQIKAMEDTNIGSGGSDKVGASFGVTVRDTGNQQFNPPSFTPSNDQSDSVAKGVAKGLAGSRFSVEGSKRGMYLFIKDGERQQSETLV